PIQQEFADAILTGHKPFEYRKVLGEQNPTFLLLYVRETSSIPGAFAPGRILRGTPDELWRLTAGRGTSPERFRNYFEDQDRGVAVEVRRYERFRPPISQAEIDATGIVLPPNFNLVYANGKLVTLARNRGVILRELQRRALLPGLDSFGRVDVVSFESRDREPFVSLVTEEIAKWYDDIDAEFAESLVASHAGGEQHGLLTIRKTIHVFERSGERIGYTVATEKRGGSVKFGPTVIDLPSQGHGFAVSGRARLEESYKARGFRKAYSTIPDTHHEALIYLLKAGYHVEAHLRSHYSRDHGEFVVGKRLLRGTGIGPTTPSETGPRAPVSFRASPPPAESLWHFVRLHLSPFYDGLDTDFVASVLEARPDVPQEEKPRGVQYAYTNSEVAGFASLSANAEGPSSSDRLRHSRIRGSSMDCLNRVRSRQSTNSRLERFTR
ncbi:MAG: hypothetical protein AUI33_04845, partial [Ignavibacteria bacterium 13_1_40CM_2_61_4]